MARSADVVKKIMRFKLQLTDSAESATVLKILHKLKDLDVTLDILAETGIGKTVNSLRRHKQAGEVAKTLVKDWKRLVPKESTSKTEDGDLLEHLSVKNTLDDKDCPNNGSLTKEDLNNNFLKHQDHSWKSLGEALFKTGNWRANSEKQCEEQMKHKDQDENQRTCPQENHNVSQNVLKKECEIQEDKMEDTVVSSETSHGQSNRKSVDNDTLFESKSSEDTMQKSKSESKEKMKSSSHSGRLAPVKELNKKTNVSKEAIMKKKESSSFETSDKYLKTSKCVAANDDRSSGISRSSEALNRKRKKRGEEKPTTLQFTQDSENKGHSQCKNKKAKMKHKDKERYVDQEEPSGSFESCLNYDVNVLKRKERSGMKKPRPKNRTIEKDPDMKTFKSPVMSNLTSEKQFKESVMVPMNTSSLTVFPECERPPGVEYYERKVDKESNFCDIPEESAIFTGQRLNRKMQVYSGAKTIFLPAMMSLHQQCIRTLQNNINCGVPFEILEPVLERCTPEQLLRIEEYNPIYIGVTDHLWGKHCQRDFKESKLQEYESWKEMYIRLSEEREMKFQRLTKSIVSAHSKKPKGRQVKMAFIHTVAKPPRDVRIQQEIHGTAVQQPSQPRCSVKVPDNRLRPSCNEPSRSSNTASVPGNTQDTRKKTKVAPMMAKSLKAFKKQLGRR